MLYYVGICQLLPTLHNYIEKVRVYPLAISMLSIIRFFLITGKYGNFYGRYWRMGETLEALSAMVETAGSD